MSAIESSTVGMKTMADGTLRLTLDIEPRFAKGAFGLFGAPGTPCAIAALRIGTQAPAEPEKPKGGPLAKLAGQWCGEEKFQDWMLSNFPSSMEEQGLDIAVMVRNALCEICCIKSRAELDHDPRANTLFNRFIRIPYMAHLEACTA